MTETDVNRLFSFSVGSHSVEGDENGESRKQRNARDPMSHRIIEKRRRDRMNNCLADLSQLIPTTFMKQGQGRIEKTEIIEMAIRHIKYLQSCTNSLNGEEHASSSEEMFLKGYQECQSDVFSYFEEVGCCVTDSVLLCLKSELDSKITQLQSVLSRNSSQCGLKDPGENFATGGDCSQWNFMSVDASGSSTSTNPHPKVEFSLGSASSHPECISNNKHEFSLVHSGGGSQDGGPRDSGMGSSTVACGVSGDQGSSEVSSSFTDSNKGSLTGQDDVKPTVYKFKQDIQQRFSSHLVPPTTTDHSHHRKRSEKEEDLREAHHHQQQREGDFIIKDPSQQPSSAENSQSISISGSTCGSGSSSVYSCAKSGNSSNSCSTNNSSSRSNSSQDISLNNTVPAFALHPMGYFYIPVVLPIAQVMPFIAGHKSMGVCHPISIPISFTGPFSIGASQGSGTGSGGGNKCAMTAGMQPFGATPQLQGGMSGGNHLPEFNPSMFSHKKKRRCESHCSREFE